MSVDRYLGRRYDPDRYNCAHFAAEVWLDLTGEDIREALGVLLGPEGCRRVPRDAVRHFHRLPAAEDPSLVVMQRPRTSPHVGVYLRGRVLHIQQRGVQFMEPAVASMGFSRVTYFR